MTVKVAIIIPSTDDWRADFGMSLAGLVAHAAAAGLELRLFNFRHAYVTFGRNRLIREALAWGAESVLHLESDMRFPRDALTRLLAWDKDCVVANYVPRAAENAAAADRAWRAGQQLTGYAAIGQTRLPLNTAVRLRAVDSAPLGLALLSAKALRLLTPPWAEFEGALDLAGDREATTGPAAFTTDDYMLCRKLRAAGMEVLVDTALSREVRHVGLAYFGPAGPEMLPLLHVN